MHDLQEIHSDDSHDGHDTRETPPCPFVMKENRRKRRLKVVSWYLRTGRLKGQTSKRMTLLPSLPPHQSLRLKNFPSAATRNLC